jgi:hypothetical protein
MRFARDDGEPAANDNDKQFLLNAPLELRGGHRTDSGKFGQESGHNAGMKLCYGK